MKSVITLILFIAFSHLANAQQRPLELNKGKYFEHPFKNDFVGNWRGENLTIKIAKEKQHFKRGSADLFFDALKIQIIRFVDKQEDISQKFAQDIVLISINNDSFGGTYKDPVTGNNVKLTLKQIDKNNLILSAQLPEIDPENDIHKGTILPKETKFVKY